MVLDILFLFLSLAVPCFIEFGGVEFWRCHTIIVEFDGVVLC